MRAYDQARAAGLPVFYEAATDTIRTCPENYCLAVQRGGRWTPFVDAGVGRQRAGLAAVIRRHSGASAEDMVATLAATYTKPHSRHSKRRWRRR